jgi:hypothetical protein
MGDFPNVHRTRHPSKLASVHDDGLYSRDFLYYLFDDIRRIIPILFYSRIHYNYHYPMYLVYGVWALYYIRFQRRGNSH